MTTEAMQRKKLMKRKMAMIVMKRKTMFVNFKSSSSILTVPFIVKLVVEDVTSSFKSKQRKRNGNCSKALASDFSNPRLAVFAKRCTRMATCIVDMCPQDPLFSWPTFTEEIERLVNEGRGQDFVEALANISEDPNLRDHLVRFVSQSVVMCGWILT